VRKVTKFFKQTEIRIAFKNNNTISQILRSKTPNNTPIYNKCGVYKITCKTCQYGTIEDMMKLLKSTRHASMLIPYESFFIQSHQQQNQFISEQNPANSIRSSNWAIKPHRHTAQPELYDPHASSHSDGTTGWLHKQYVHLYTQHLQEF
jgi:hypothetical protein